VNRMASRTTTPAPTSARLASLISQRERIVREFFEREADRLARACLAMARQFSRGGTLIPFTVLVSVVAISRPPSFRWAAARCGARHRG